MKWIKASERLPARGKFFYRYLDKGEMGVFNNSIDFKVQLDFDGYHYKKDQVEWLDENELDNAGNQSISELVKNLPCDHQLTVRTPSGKICQKCGTRITWANGGLIKHQKKQQMTHQEKADELVMKFIRNVYCYSGSGMLTNTYDNDVATKNATDCAAKLVNTMIEKALLDVHEWQQILKCLK